MFPFVNFTTRLSFNMVICIFLLLCMEIDKRNFLQVVTAKTNIF